MAFAIVIMLSVAIKFTVLSVIMLNVILLSVIMLTVIGTVLIAFSLFKNWIDATDMFQFFVRVR